MTMILRVRLLNLQRREDNSECITSYIRRCFSLLASAQIASNKRINSCSGTVILCRIGPISKSGKCNREDNKPIMIFYLSALIIQPYHLLIQFVTYISDSASCHGSEIRG